MIGFWDPMGLADLPLWEQDQEAVIGALCSCSPSLVKAILLLSPRQRPFKPDLLRGVVNVCDTCAAEH